MKSTQNKYGKHLRIFFTKEHSLFFLPSMQSLHSFKLHLTKIFLSIIFATTYNKTKIVLKSTKPQIKIVKISFKIGELCTAEMALLK